MSTEEKLKDLILSRYKSVREFTIEIDIPYTTLDSIFKRGIGNSSVTTVLKICKALRISADALAEDKIEPMVEVNLYQGEDADLDQIYTVIGEMKLTVDEMTRFISFVKCFRSKDKEILRLCDLDLTVDQWDELYKYACYLRDKKP